MPMLGGPKRGLIFDRGGRQTDPATGMSTDSSTVALREGGSTAMCEGGQKLHLFRLDETKVVSLEVANSAEELVFGFRHKIAVVDF